MEEHSLSLSLHEEHDEHYHHKKYFTIENLDFLFAFFSPNFFLIMGVMIAYMSFISLDEIRNGIVDDFFNIDDEDKFVKNTSGISHIIQFVACAICLLSIVEVPVDTFDLVDIEKWGYLSGGKSSEEHVSETKSLVPKFKSTADYVVDQTKSATEVFLDHVIWKLHMCILILITSTVNSRSLISRLDEHRFFISSYHFNIDPGDGYTENEFFDLLIGLVLTSRMALFLVGIIMILINWNTSVRAYDNKQTLANSTLDMTVAFFTSVPLIFGILVSFFNLLAEWNVAHETAVRIISFSLEWIASILLSVLAIYHTWIVEDNEDNNLASSIGFNQVFLGLFLTCMCTVGLYSLDTENTAFAYNHYKITDAQLHAWAKIQFIFYWVVVGLNILYETLMMKQHHLKENAKRYGRTIYKLIGGNHAPPQILWKIAIITGFISLLIIIFSTQSEWFEFKVRAGSAPRLVLNAIHKIIDFLKDAGKSALDFLKQLDPCNHLVKYSMPAGNDKYQAKYPDAYPDVNPQGVDATMNRFAPANIDPRCEAGHDCPEMSVMTRIRDKYKTGTQDVDKIATDQSDIMRVRTQRDLTYDKLSTYGEEMHRCHMALCDTLLAFAIACEIAVFSSSALSFIPGLGDALKLLAWLGHTMNRITRMMLKLAVRMGRWLVKLFFRIERIGPLIKFLYNLAYKQYQLRYGFSLAQFGMYIPLLINATFCFATGFWKRENVHKAFQQYNIITGLFIPLVLIQFVMFIFCYLFPIIVNAIADAVPDELFEIKAQEHMGFALIRRSYLISTASSAFLFLSALLNDAYNLQSTIHLWITNLRRNASVTSGFVKYKFRKTIARVSGFRISNALASSTSDEVANEEEEEEDFKLVDVLDIQMFQAFATSLPTVAMFIYSVSMKLESFRIFFGPTGDFMQSTQSYNEQASTNRETNETELFVEEETSLCGIIEMYLIKLINLIIQSIKNLMLTILKYFIDLDTIVSWFGDILKRFIEGGAAVIDIITSQSQWIEALLFLGVPMFVTFLFLYGAYTIPHIEDQEARIQTKASTLQIAATAVGFQITTIFMITQVLASISNMSLYVIYFKYETGPLISLGLIAALFNAAAILLVFIDDYFPLHLMTNYLHKRVHHLTTKARLELSNI